MNILMFIFIPLIIGLLMVLFHRKFLKYIALIAQGVLFYQSIINLRQILLTKEVISIRLIDEGLLGILFEMDQVSAIFILLTSFLFLSFSIYLLKSDETDDLFYFLFLTIQGLIALIFLSMDMFNIFVLVEVATMICGILIMYLKEKRAVYDGLVYIMLNTIGIMFYLLGVGMLYKIFGNLDMVKIGELVNQVPKKTLIIPLSLVFTGMGVKSAIFPMFLWLPKAHGTPGAPSVVSAILSGIYIKSTLYVWIRLYGVFHGVFHLGRLLLVLGIITALAGIVFAILSKEMKQILAYHTISQIGLILIGIASAEEISNYGGILHMVNHALFKSLLFLTIGVVMKVYKRKKVAEVSGLLRSYPVVGIALIVGILGITGAPLFNGSISKYMIASGYSHPIIRYILELINIGTMVSFIKLGAMLFGEKKTCGRVAVTEKISLVIVSLAVFLTGIYGFQIVDMFSGIAYHFSYGDWMIKLIYWIGYFIIGVGIYQYILPRIPIYKEGYVLDLSFYAMVFTIPISFLIYFVYFNIAL